MWSAGTGADAAEAANGKLAGHPRLLQQTSSEMTTMPPVPDFTGTHAWLRLLYSCSEAPHVRARFGLRALICQTTPPAMFILRHAPRRDACTENASLVTAFGSLTAL